MVTSLLIFARCTGFIFRAPGFSHPSVPPALRAGLSVALTIAIASAGPNTHRTFSGAALLAVLIAEFIAGSAIGMAASLLYDAAYAGGRIVDDYVGVKAIAPSLQLVAPSGFGRVWSLAFTGAFFLCGAYRVALLEFARSFTRIPLGSPLDERGWLGYVGAFASTFLLIALQVAAPAMALAFIMQIALGALSRVVPRFGSFTLAFPLAFAAALVATAIALPVLATHIPAPLLPIP